MSSAKANNPNSPLHSEIAQYLENNPIIVADLNIKLSLATEEWSEQVAQLYKDEYQRGDYFASRYKNPDAEVFSPEWQRESFNDPERMTFLFTDDQNDLLGATAFIHDKDSYDGTPLWTSDETQIAPEGRHKRIMRPFFNSIVPIIEASGAGLATDFVLTPETKGLRRTLQSNLGMIAIGIHPHALHHQIHEFTRSEIAAIKLPTFMSKSVALVEGFAEIYNIVRRQLPNLDKPTIESGKVQQKFSQFIDNNTIITNPVSAEDPDEQARKLENGWLPIEYNPDSNSFLVAKFPDSRPNLNFIIINENILANKALVRYLYFKLYKQLTTEGSSGE